MVFVQRSEFLTTQKYSCSLGHTMDTVWTQALIPVSNRKTSKTGQRSCLVKNLLRSNLGGEQVFRKKGRGITC
jgi:hypothetical protein